MALASKAREIFVAVPWGLTQNNGDKNTEKKNNKEQGQNHPLSWGCPLHLKLKTAGTVRLPDGTSLINVPQYPPKQTATPFRGGATRLWVRLTCVWKKTGHSSPQGGKNTSRSALESGGTRQGGGGSDTHNKVKSSKTQRLDRKDRRWGKETRKMDCFLLPGTSCTGKGGIIIRAKEAIHDCVGKAKARLPQLNHTWGGEEVLPRNIGVLHG